MSSVELWSALWLKELEVVSRRKPLADCVLRAIARPDHFLEGFLAGVSYNGWHGLNIMKIIKQITAAALMATFLAAPFAGLAAEAKSDDKAKDYPLKTCVVSGEKLG